MLAYIPYDKGSNENDLCSRSNYNWGVIEWEL